MRLILCLLFVVGLSCTGLCQSFKGEANLPKVEADGFYRIFISPEISTHLNFDFTNIRIYDGGDKETPYLFQEESPIYYSQRFKEYEIVEKEHKKNCCTSLILRNPDGRPINNISLSIKNADVTKQATLLGSDDKENWFALKQQFILTAIDNQNNTSEIKIVDFPLSNYTYYLLQLEDSTTAPLNILSAGYYEVNTEDGKYTEITSLRTVKSDSTKQKRSYVHIVLDTTHVIDKLTVSLSGVPYFLRKASLYTVKERKKKKGGTELYYDLLNSFGLSAKQSSLIELQGIKAEHLVMIIENEDNPALEVASLKAYQLNRYLTAWLKKNEQYKVKIGNEDIGRPSYDLAFFKDSIPNQPPVLAIGKVNIFKEKGVEESATFFTSRSIIWLAIGLVVVILGFMSIKLIRETGEVQK